MAGGTGYWNIDTQHRRLEIGFTWLHPRWQRTAINTEAMLALEGMSHWMEELYGYDRVRAVTMASLVVDLRITQIVNGVRGAHAILAHDALGGASVR